ncbi:chemotaxis protein CheB [Ramlibacter monticola]|uniref:PAS domain-containing protein n=1 Tax=Ramlibacter monticola TaxID=1926872 RepID=A0A937CRX2_9BURK|nr:chemotaxis protein CheB [Ramlibacter monticola]MBL0391140.1 PAS domain-containing protein [Ramlibacter monticola]
MDTMDNDVFPIVGIGASAGGLEAFMQLLQALPAHTGMAFVLVQHLDPRYDSRLADLLAKATAMPVLEAAQGLAVQPDHVYVIAPDTTLTLAAGGVLQTEPRGDQPGPHLPIDRFFRSLAAIRASAAIGVVLSGTGTDGSMGLEEIKAAGGVAFAQDEASAKFAGMPLAAAHTGSVDLVLPPARIAAELARVGQHPYLVTAADQRPDDDAQGNDRDGGFRAVLALLREATGVDFAAYRDTTIKRRITRRLMLHGDDSLGAYAQRLRADRAELDALYQDILINVTQFFREPELFEALKERVFPAILAAKQGAAPIRIWVPGCSAGQEAYSLAMALFEFLDDKPAHPPIQIFATDLSETVSLQKARNGLYPDSIEAEVSPERLRRFFLRENSHYRVNKALREIVVFARQNVAADPPFSHVDLVSCRNLLIYLSPALQKRVIPTFHYALNPGGFMVLGASETIGAHTDLFTVVDQPHRVYLRKSTGPGRPYPHFRAEDHQAGIAGRRDAIAARVQPADWQREADRVAAGLYVPPGVLIDDNFDILQFRGQTGSFLSPAAGEPSNNLLKMAREGLLLAARSAVAECQRSGVAVRQADVRIRGDGVDREIDLHVMPIKLPMAGERCYLVLFEEKLRRVTPSEPAQGAPRDEAGDAADAHHLRQELASTREYLQSLIEQQDAANEELKSANEEVLSSNEELQSTNEELETAKEELQSINEELTTVNEQLQHRNSELGRLNDDMSNLVTCSGMLTVVLGVDSRIRRFTPAAGKLFGLLAGDIGRPLGQLKTALEPLDMDALVAEVVASVQPQEREIHGPDDRTYQLRIHPYRTTDNRIDGVVLVLFDIEDLRRAQASMRGERDYAEAIVETVSQPLLVLDSHLRVRSANGAFYTTFGVTPRDTEGQLVYELGNHQWDIAVLREQLAQVLKDSSVVVDLEVRHDFETIGLKVMQVKARRIVHEGSDTDLILLAIEDRTEIERLGEQVRQHLTELIERDRGKTAFLSLLAHELRNPLAPIRNAQNVLGQAGISEETARHMRDVIERQVQQLTRLVDDLLDIARINQGRVEVRRSRIDLGQLLAAAIEEARPSCEARTIELITTLPREPVAMDADAARMTQVVSNLLNNATKFTDPGGRIALSLERAGDEAIVRVADNGIGIPSNQLARVFDMFTQVDPSLERSRTGLGLGLTLVKQLVEAHGGTVTVASDGPGLGSEVVLHLPLPRNAVPIEEPDAAPAPGAAATASRRVLIVEDNDDGAQSLATLLGLHGHDARTAPDGPTALALAASWRPEVVLLDIGLPGMSGYEVARRLGQQPWRRDMRLIALSGWGQGDHPELAAQAGFDARLVKPADIQALVGMVSAPPPPK